MNHLAAPPNQAMPAEIESHHNLARRTSSLFEELITFAERYRERFFDEYMFTGCQGSQGNFGVQARGHAHRNNVHIRVREQRLIILITARNTEAIRGHIQSGFVTIRCRDHLPIGEVSKAREVQVRRCPAATHEPHAQPCT